MASPSSVAAIIVQKYIGGQPLYRQEQQLESEGFPLPRQTMANWVIQCTDLWFSLIYNRMHQLLVEQGVLHADETGLQVLKEPNRKATQKSRMWLYRTGQRGKLPIILYEYQPTRHAEHPQNFLKGFKGFLHVDGYAGYNELPATTLVGCFAHARRKFVDALKAISKHNRSTVIANEGLSFCNQLYTIERKLREASDQDRYKKRKEHSQPVLDKFFSWLKIQELKKLPGQLGTAINYCLNQWHKLEGFMLDGRLEIDNNLAERSIKPFVIGRKNWLFSSTPEGATASAMIYSVVETAKANGLNPYEYLVYLLETLPNMKTETNLDSLLPWSPDLPDNCKSVKSPPFLRYKLIS